MKQARYFLAVIVSLLLISFTVKGQTITTIAGNGTMDYTGDGGPADSAALYNPTGVAVDRSGNVYISDFYYNTVREVNTAGIINTIAGMPMSIGYSGDGGPATSAQLWDPSGLAVDGSGNLYIADQNNNCIRMVTPSGTISTFAGNNTPGYSGDGGPATAAQLYKPANMAIDSNGNVYIADTYNSVIRKVSSSGIISTFAGNDTAGYTGDGGPADSAELNNPTSVAVDDSGNVFIADYDNNVIRKVNALGIISTVAGNGLSGYVQDGVYADSTELSNPSGVAVDAAGHIYITDLGNNRVRVVNSFGIISTIAGNGTNGFSGDNGPAFNAQLNAPLNIAIDTNKNAYICDAYNYRIRRLSSLTDAVSILPAPHPLNLYPDPTTGIFTIGIPERAEVSAITIYDLCGRLVKSIAVAPNTKSVQADLSNAAPGTYLVKLQNSTNSEVRKIVVE